MRRYAVAGLAVILVMGLTYSTPLPVGAATNFELISQGNSDDPGDGISFLAADKNDRGFEHPLRTLTDDGRYVVFTSEAENWFTGGNGIGDVFLRDRAAGQTFLISQMEDGTAMQASGFTDPGELRPSISSDGQKVAFFSYGFGASAPCDERRGIYVKEPFTGALTNVTPDVVDPDSPTDTEGNPNCDGRTGFDPSISPDGTVVAFGSRYDWAGGSGESFPLGSAPGVFVRDLLTNVIEMAPGRASAELNGDGYPRPDLTTDGSKVVFLGSGYTTNTAGDVYAYLWNRNTGSVSVVSVNKNGAPRPATGATISDDGRFVAFTTLADDIKGEDTNGTHDVFVHRLSDGNVELANVPNNLGQFIDGADSAYISSDGRYVVFRAGDDFTVRGYVWMRDRTDNKTIRITPTPESFGTVDGYTPSVTPDGCFTAFSSTTPIDNLDPGFTSDVYVRTRGCAAPVKARLVGTVYDGSITADGHSNGLHAAKVELLKNGAVVKGPVATEFGDYEFEDVEAGTYRLRVTLEEAAITEPAPVFDVRNGDSAAGPAWVEKTVTISDSEALAQVRRDIAFSSSETLAAVTPDVPATQRGRLDDMANLFFRMRQYITWLNAELVLELSNATRPPPVEIHMFSEELGADDNALYRRAGTLIKISRSLSAYTERDGRGSDTGPFVEWHEFTHHLTNVNLSDAGCGGGSLNHRGYKNPSTCDSFSEGFAAFLPTMFSNHQRAVIDGSYDSFGVDFESNLLDAWGNVRIQVGTSTVNAAWREEFAVAALLWDLTDARADTESTRVIAEDGSHVAVTYTDTMQLPLATLWNIIDTANTTTVVDLLSALIAAADVAADDKLMTINLDGVGVGDAAPVHIPFLMHGFYPVQAAESGGSHMHYDVDVADDLGFAGTSDGRAIGFTDSRHPETGVFRSQRRMAERVPGSMVSLKVVDPSGKPFFGTTATVRVEYPDLTDVFEVPLLEGVAQIYLELPAHYEGLLADTDDLPDCSQVDPSRIVTVTITAGVGSADSNGSVSFSNCEYTLAVAETTGEVAMTGKVTVPKVATKTTIKAVKKGRKLVLSGQLVPGKPGAVMLVGIQKRVGDKWKTVVGAKTKLGAAIDANENGVLETRYRKTLGRVKGSKCRAVAAWRGDSSHKRSAAISKPFAC